MPLWAQGDLRGEMTSVKGTVNVVRGKATPLPLHKHDQVLAGDEIVTDRKSSASVRMPDGSTLRIYPNSRMVLLDESGSWRDFLHVWLGNVRVQIERLSGRPNPKTLTTPTAVISVRGTIFSVAVDQDGNTQVGVEKGLVSVANQMHPADEVMVKPGQSVWVRRNQRPTQPQRMRMGSGEMGMPGTGGMGAGPVGGMGGRR